MTTEELEVLYLDEWFVAVNKPSGLLVHRSMIDRRETRFAMQLVRDQIGRHVYPLHRLDKPTSGVLLFALDPETARLCGELFSARETRKSYLAVVRGYTDEEGLVDHPLKEMLDKMTDARAQQDKEAQEAVTSYTRLDIVEFPFALGRYDTVRYSLVRLLPRTGRKHQLRRHMKHISHHIVGDTKHGRGEHNRLFREKFGCHRLLLHAESLAFTHPHTQEKVCIRAPLDEHFGGIVETFGWRDSLKEEA